MVFLNVVLREVFVLFSGSGHLHSTGSRPGVLGSIPPPVSEERLRPCTYHILQHRIHQVSQKDWILYR